jgi:hypothetical protein
MYNRNCDKASTDLKLRLRVRWKFYATGLANPLELTSIFINVKAKANPVTGREGP